MEDKYEPGHFNFARSDESVCCSWLDVSKKIGSLMDHLTYLVLRPHTIILVFSNWEHSARMDFLKFCRLTGPIPIFGPSQLVEQCIIINLYNARHFYNEDAQEDMYKCLRDIPSNLY